MYPNVLPYESQMNSKYPKMSESAKLKHSYSLTSLSTRFLNGNNGNAHGYPHPQPHPLTSSGVGGLGQGGLNHHHQSMLMPSTTHTNGHAKDSLDNIEPGGSDDYGFLSFRDQDFRDSSSTLTSNSNSKPSTNSSTGQLLRNSSFYSTSTSYLNLSNSGGNSSFTTRQQHQPLSISQVQHFQPHGVQVQHQLLPTPTSHAHPHVNSTSNSNSMLVNGMNTPGATSRQASSTKQKCTATVNGNSSHSMSMCGCDCHAHGIGGGKLSKTEVFRNNFNAKRDASNNLLKSNSAVASSCQTLNLCSTTNTNHNHQQQQHLGAGNGNGSTNCNNISMYGNMYGATSNNPTSNGNGLAPDVHNNPNSTGNGINGHGGGMSLLGGGVVENRKNPSVRVRRTLSCYAKNPSRNDILESNLAAAGAKEFTGSVNVVANCGNNSGGSGNNGNGYHQPLNNYTNPICEFSPYSSLSSNDLLGLRLSNGYIDKRYSSINNGANYGLSTVFFHDNPQDCGCPNCFQTKLSIFQANQKKPAVVSNGNGSNGSNGSNNNKEDTSTTTSPVAKINGGGVVGVNGNNAPTIANYSCKTQDSDISWPLTPEEAVGCFSSRLTSWELSEISKYPQCWYLGQEAVRKINGDKTNPLNAGYDDDAGNYHKVTRDHLAYRYEILEVIGKGSFGQVIKAIDHKTQSQVAIKIIRNKKRFHAQALVEVKILEHLRKRDQDSTVIRMFSSFYFRSHLCIVFELMSLNLYELIRRNHYQGFSTGLIRKFAVSLLKCLALLKKENIIHCDLKPENILLRRRGSSAIKVIDLGSSCFGHERVFSYIQSRFYRAPEVILGIPYTTAIDVWSLGCVLAELSTGNPIFPGENEVEQLACIMETLGIPGDGLITVATRRRLFFDSRNQPRCIRNSKGKIRRPGTKDLSTAIKSEDLDFISFLRKCLTWDPQERLTPSELLMEPWITSGANGVVANPVSRKNYV